MAIIKLNPVQGQDKNQIKEKILLENACKESLYLVFGCNNRKLCPYHFTNITRTCFGLSSGKVKMCYIRICKPKPQITIQEMRLRLSASRCQSISCDAEYRNTVKGNLRQNFHEAPFLPPSFLLSLSTSLHYSGQLFLPEYNI